MARAFASASSQYLTNATAAIAALPLTMACWARPSSATAARTALSLHTSGSANNRLNLRVTSAHVPEMITRDTSPNLVAAASAMTANVWGHIAGVWASTTSRTCYRNGVAGTTGTTSKTPSGWNTTDIGRLSTPTADYWDGDLAEAAMWSAALTTAEIAILAQGYSPLCVRPESLVAYWPLIGDASPERERVGRVEMTLTNAPTAVAHPRVLFPSAFFSRSQRGASVRRLPLMLQTMVRGTLPPMY